MRHHRRIDWQHGRTNGSLRNFLFAIAVFVLVPEAGAAQRAGDLRGAVVDSASGLGIALVEITIEGRAERVLSDERGTFHLTEVAAGPLTLRVRRLGFEPRAIVIGAGQARAPLTIRLVPSLRYLDVVVVQAEKKKYSGRLAGYYSRLERRAQGVFITREDLEREHPTQLTDMLQRQPGVRITRGRPGAQSIRMRGRECRPLVWLDGAAMPAGDVDFDSFSPASLEGIELYLGSSVPAGYQAARGQSECGTVLLWSRGVDTEPHRETMATPAELEEMLTSLRVFGADQVDRRATLDSTAGWAVPYPASLRASGASGRVVAEFVVDTLGRVELSHFGIVSSTNPLFSGAVRESAVAARFIPALLGGKLVRQLVRQPFDFQPASETR